MSTAPRSALEDPEALLRLQRRFHDGDLDAMRDLAAPWMDLLYTHCLRMLRTPEAAEDVAQDALVRAARQHRRYDPARPFRPWLLTIAANLCRDRLRSTWWRRVLSLDRPVDGEGDSAEVSWLAEERDAKVREALATLPPKYREALSLFHLDDMSYAEMAEITGVTVAALKQRVRRGSGMLRDALQGMYPELVPDRTQDDR